jgi:N12 class adenine-specific DNA methylase
VAEENDGGFLSEQKSAAATHRAPASDLETVIPAQLNPSGQRRELDRPRFRTRDAEEYVAWLSMEKITLLHRPAARAVIGEAIFL